MSGLTSEILFEKFQIIEVLKKDEHAAVYLANHIYLSKKIILKVLNTQKIPDHSIVERFKREAKILAKLDYPHIIKVLDFGMSREYFYISFEYIEGESLRNALKSKNLSLEQKEHLTVQLLRGLNYAHANQIIHRDIKPENIFIDKNLNLKIGDFGLALSAEDNFVTNPYSIVGTPSYMSPEQVRGAKLTPRSDLFSAGVVLFELFTGKNPFLKDNVSLTLNEINSYDESELEEKLTDVKEPYKEILLKLLKKNVNLRYETAAEILEKLNIPVEQPSLVISGINRGKKSTKIIWTLVGLAALIIIGIFIYPRKEIPKDKIVYPEQPGNTQQVNNAKTESNSAGQQKETPNTVDQNQVKQTQPVDSAAQKIPAVVKNNVPDNTNSQPGNLGYGGLDVQVRPWAHVYINNEDFDVTPLKNPIKLPEGYYTLKLIHPDYPPLYQSVNIKSNRVSNIKIDLDTTVSFIRCNVNPYGDVYVNGNLRSENQRSSSLIRVNPGLLKLSIKNPYWAGVDTSFIIRKKDTLKLVFNLKKR